MSLCVLFQFLPGNGDGRVHWDKCDKGLHIIRHNAFPFPKSDGFDLVHKVLGIPEIMWGMSYQWPKDIGQLLSNPWITSPLLQMDLRRESFLWSLGSPIDMNV